MADSSNRIKLGLPKGSLNTLGRGNTHQILIDAGYDIVGYEPGKESDQSLTIVNDPEIIAFLTRPQSAPVELSRGMLDAAIVGGDWIKEEGTAGDGNNIQKVGDLEYGQTRLVVAIPIDSGFQSLSDFFVAQKGRKNPILCFTEYVNLTRDYFMQNEGYRQMFGDQRPLVQIRGQVNGENKHVQILNSDGVTEGYIAKGADLIVDISQTGSALMSYGLKELEQIAGTSPGIYAGPTCTGWKQKKAESIFKLLKSAIEGRKYFDVKFNVPADQTEKVKAHLMENKLCADEPSVVEGRRFDQVNVLILRSEFPLLTDDLEENFGVSAIVRNEIKQYKE